MDLMFVDRVFLMGLFLGKGFKKGWILTAHFPFTLFLSSPCLRLR
ncbi:hypothetical protein HanRHA438_Chr10g0454971 [Helianthus annuus]|uniref:Uncharacterized protein n=1 Tax=Helianthus annuus TaxID=4232 RepID=A0A9K3HYA3_HELAN|nr:hypothetical protein HanXRQr2_Chr10g0442821 [Helianthus annuus]KAJ0521989.1 hypothetical protein HanIR_Chr10g0477381 [Helianthus annuus]KAJ0879736.1 hypothetical protein HanRHA438_Chr10g0454971 [Helianthus annuus]